MAASLAELLATCGLEERAGFAARLALLAGPDVVLPPGMLNALDDFFTITGIEVGQSAAERQRRVDGYFRLWPLPAALAALLEATALGLSRRSENDGYRAGGKHGPLAGVKAGEHVPTRASDDALFGGRR